MLNFLPMLTDPKWNDFKNFLSAIEQTRKFGSDIVRNEIAPGIQLDITLKFRLPFYEFLTSIRCLNSSEKVTLKEVHALSAVSSDLGADKVVMVSNGGFENDAADFAKNKDIELYQTSEVMKIQGESLSKILSPNLIIYGIKFKLKGIDKWIVLPEDKNLPEYLRKNLMINSKYRTKAYKA